MPPSYLRLQVLWPSSNTLLKDTDLFVGAVIPILKRNFELLDADEFTYQYMENNRQVYPVADPNAAVQTITDAINTGIVSRVPAFELAIDLHKTLDKYSDLFKKSQGVWPMQPQACGG